MSREELRFEPHGRRRRLRARVVGLRVCLFGFRRGPHQGRGRRRRSQDFERRAS
jgi:hypothetical protein